MTPAPHRADRRAFGVALLALALAMPSGALALAVPGEAVVLSVTGRVGTPNAGGRADFDMAMLAALPQTSYTVETPWFTDPSKFTGPLLRDVLAAAGAKGQTVRALALNDYRVDIPWDDIERYDVVLARLLDDRPMAVRDKGPLFVIYPFHTRRELRTAVYFSRCAWQLRGLEIR
jgi:hypothetical protein